MFTAKRVPFIESFISLLRRAEKSLPSGMLKCPFHKSATAGTAIGVGPATQPSGKSGAAPVQMADVTLLLEGTYPYVSGGVSSWVHQIIRGLPEIKFSLVFLGGDPKLYGEP